MSPALVTHYGGCHCGAVSFELDAPSHVVAWDCNCSLCAMRRNTHFMVPKKKFRLTCSENTQTEYRFHTCIARHLFCKTCGVCSFYQPRSNPDCWAVTVNCIKPGTLREVEFKQFDGRNWEEAYASTGIGKAKS